MDGNTREDPHIGQPEEKIDHGDKSMLFAYVGKGVNRSFASSVASGCTGLYLAG
jgi:hypothetical protein